MLSDTHCHLDFDIFKNERTEVIDRARSAGVVRILDPGINVLTSQNAIKLAKKYPEVYAAVGVHPNEADSWDEESINRLQILAAQPKVVAIGEIGCMSRCATFFQWGSYFSPECNHIELLFGYYRTGYI
jgi:TatD DNase family protein